MSPHHFDIRPNTVAGVFVLLFIAACSGGQPTDDTRNLVTVEHVDRIGPPVAEIREHNTEIHGVHRSDDYYWMNDAEDPAVIAYLEAENVYTDVMMAHTQDLQQQLYDEMLGRVQETDLSVPYQVDDYFYYSRTEEGLDYPIFCRRRGSMDADEEILLDQNSLSTGDDGYLEVWDIEVSPDHTLLAYMVDRVGDEDYTLEFRDLSTGQALETTIEHTSYDVEWANDNQTVFFTRRDDALRPHQLWRFSLGQSPDEATLLHQEDDERFWMSVGSTRSHEYLLMEFESQITTEVHLLDADEPAGDFDLVAAREDGVEYSIEHAGEYFYQQVNRHTSGERAPNFRVIRRLVTSDTPAVWDEVIAHRDEVLIEALEGFRDWLVIVERNQGLLQLRMVELSTGEEHYVAFDEPTYTVESETNAEYETNSFRFMFTSLVSPKGVYSYDMQTRERELLKQDEVVGDFDSTNYVQERVFATAEDGTLVPISLVYRRGTELNGSNPAILMGYGAYGYPYDPYFSNARITLIDRGFVYGIAHIRGGGELGRQWYEDGKLMLKRNTFTDYIACAEYLIEAGYTSSDQLAASGGSAGGLLMGAVANMRPDLFEVIVAEVPFVDVVTTMLDETIPLTVVEWEEWGNPNEPEAFEYMASYSPYDNVVVQDYPHMLITAGLNDNRVGYWEPAKWNARLRAMRSDDNLQLLRVNMGAGHMGASGRYGQYEELAFYYAFILDRLGVE